ncbi:MAG: glycoside hydrolase family 172 protein [Candidatus Helarchaeota archaeon]
MEDGIHLIKKNVRTKQVSTHSHEYNKWLKTNHLDFVQIAPNSTHVFPEIQDGPGIITCMWFTLTPCIPEMIGYAFYPFSKIKGLKQVRLRLYFDDEKEPRVDCPFGDFFSVGFGYYVRDVARSRYVGQTSGGYYSHFPMPFKKSARIEVFNGKKKQTMVPFTLYGAITYQTVPELPADIGYFNAAYREECPTTEGKPYVILERDHGPGQYIGCVLSMKGLKKIWSLNPLAMYDGRFGFLEGNLKVFVDGEKEPSIEYTGTEDYFMGAWYYIKGVFSHLYHGTTVKNRRKKEVSCYRFHPEAIPWEKSVQVLIHHGEFDEFPAEYSSVAYWYEQIEK